MNFEEYLISKKIDSSAFKTAEPGIWQAWRDEFEEMHPNSFTIQKLNLINPVRRKYQLKTLPTPPEKGLQPVLELKEPTTQESTIVKPEVAGEKSIEAKPIVKSSIPKPVFKPKPKLN